MVKVMCGGGSLPPVVSMPASHAILRTPLLLSAVILKLGLRRCSNWVIEENLLTVACVHKAQTWW